MGWSGAGLPKQSYSMLSLIPIWGRIVALLALVAAIWGHGFYTAHHRDAAKYDALQAEYSGFKGNVAALGKAAEAHTAQVEANQKGITDALAKDYARRLAAIPRSVRQPNRADGSQIPTFSCSPAGASTGAADSVPIESVPKSDYDALRHDASVTTLMVLKWQDWYLEQAAAFQ